MNIEYPLDPDTLPEIGSEKLLGEHERSFRECAEILPRELRKSLYWTLRLSLAVREKKLFKQVPGYQETAIGLFDPEYEKPGFGVILIGSIGRESRKLVEFEEENNILVDDYKFPVRIRRISQELHINGSDPTGGTGGCYGVSRLSSGSPIGPGVVTAKHVVGNTIGAPVHLSCSCPATLADIAPDGIDCALVESPCSENRRQLNPIKLIPPWMPVYFDGSRSGQISTYVTSVTDTMGILSSPHLPIRIYLANHATGGDSGSLVRDKVTDEPIGLYIGAFNNPAGQTGGIVQHMFQATELMDMEIYE